MDARDTKYPIVVVGPSVDGIPALKQMLAGLPATLDAAIFVVRHGDASDGQLVDILSSGTLLSIDRARDMEPIVPGKVYIASSDRHMLVESGHIRLVRGPRENSARPAIDPLFRSAALAYGTRAIAVVLSGQLDDGTAGLLAMKDRGRTAVIQDPTDVTLPSMPKSAEAHVAVDYRCAIGQIGPLISALVAESTAPANRISSAAPRNNWARTIELKHYVCRTGVALTDLDWWNELVILSGLTCPECQGVLGEVRDCRVLRFRCQTGHAYSAMTLLKALAMTSEAAVSASLRALAQESELANRLAVPPDQAENATALSKLASGITSSVLELRTMLQSQLRQW